MSKPEFVGFQTLADGCVHFISRVPKPFGTGINIQRVPVTEANAYQSVEDILANVKLIPLEEQIYSEMDICQQVGRDNLCSYGKYFPEYGIISTFSLTHSDNPIAEVVKDGKTIYVPHPEIGKRIRRFVRKETT